MVAVGPFERRPRIAVAVSGGADSLSLCLLATDWVRRRHGELEAVTVDHRLRRGSRGEAEQVGRWLSERGIAHRILTWQGPKPTTGVQAAARAARYRLLAAYCRRQGTFHLLLGHHLDDQAETFLLRLARGSGVDGLAAMAPVVEKADLRLLRPLLSVPKQALVETLKRKDQEWIEDPSNRNLDHLRVRTRRALPSLHSLGITESGLAATAARLGMARVALEAATHERLAAATVLYPEGYAQLVPEWLLAAQPEIGRRALASVLTTVGSTQYGPRASRLEKVYEAIRESGLDRPRTLGGCRLIPKTGLLLVCREPAAAKDVVALAGQRAVIWDARFRLAFSPAGRAAVSGMRIARLGARGWAQVVAERPDLRKSRVPHEARASLPAIFDDKSVIVVPHLGYGRQGAGLGRVSVSEIAFEPVRPLATARFSVAL